MGNVFTPNPERSFTKQVTFKVPTESGGDQVVNLKTHFRSIPKSELRALQEEGADEDAYDRVVIGVEGVGSADGTAMDPGEAKAVMAEESAFVYEAMMTYYNAMLGGNLKGKTSARRRATG